MKYKDIKKTKEFKEDDNCCTVVASSIAFNVPFADMQKEYFRLGRKRYRGFHFSKHIFKLAKKYNFKISKFTKFTKSCDYNEYTGRVKNRKYYWKMEYQNNKKISNNFDDMPLVDDLPSNLTANNCTEYLDLGNYILGCSGHVLALKNGIVEDWTDGRKNRITNIYKIESNKVKDLTFDDSEFDDYLNF